MSYIKRLKEERFKRLKKKPFLDIQIQFIFAEKSMQKKAFFFYRSDTNVSTKMEQFSMNKKPVLNRK